ncbi:MAG TPA: hypothetical protein VJ872_08415 [Nocardioides sp.]|nr:hypothetical protein [Nocardioides sp.]
MNDAASSDDVTDPKPEAATAADQETPQPPEGAFDPDPADEPAEDPTPTAAVPRVQVGADEGDGGGFGTPIDTDFPTAPTKGGLTAALVSVGAGLLGAGVVIAAGHGRHGSPSTIHWSTYGVGLAATAVLLGLALFGAIGVGRKAGGQARGDLVTWPGVVGILATAPMIGVGVSPAHEGKWEAYLIGGVIACLAAIGYVIARRAAFVVVAIAGLGILYLQGFSDTVSDSFKHDNRIVVFAVALTVFVAAVTVLGWFLPSRAVSGVAVGVVGLVGLVGSMAALFAERTIVGLFGSFGGMFSGFDTGSGGASVHADTSFQPSSNPADYSGDVAWILAMVAALTLLWALAALVSDHSGFKVLAVALPAIAVPIATAVLAVRHPAIWEAALGGAGALLVLAAFFLSRRKARAAG